MCSLALDAQEALVEELQAFVRQQTAPYKYPRAIEFVRELPKTISGKIRRVELREREAASHGTASSGRAGTPKSGKSITSAGHAGS